MSVRLMIVVAALSAPLSVQALQSCPDDECECPTYGDPTRTCSDADFKCDAPTHCDEVRGCSVSSSGPGYCEGTTAGVPWTPPECRVEAGACNASGTCAECPGLPFNPCCVEPSGPCQGECVSTPPLPLIGHPDRDPFHYGLLATEQLKLEDIVVHHESPDPSAPIPPPGPACHVGTNCNTTSENGPVGVMIVNQAVFPAGTQVVVGKPKWRAKANQRPALADQVFANDWVEPGGDKVCTPSDTRQLWCYQPLLRNRYWGRCDPGATPATDACPAGDNFCHCNDSCYFEAQWDETNGADQDPATMDAGSASNGEAWTAAACDLPNVLGGDPCQLGHPSCKIITTSTAAAIAPGVYYRIQVNDGVTAKLQVNGNPNPLPFFSVCYLRLNSNASLEVDPQSVPPNTNAAITIYGRDVSMANGSKFLWTNAGTFKWVNGAQASPKAIFPSKALLGIFGSPTSTPSPAFALGSNVFLNGTFIAPQVDMALGTNSTLRGRFLGKTLIGQPKDFYCGCRAAHATCTQNSDCCSYACLAGVCS